MKKIIFFSFLLLFPVVLKAQELRCNISVSSPSIEGTNKDVYTSLQKSLSEFMNNRRWTDMYFSVNERIECNINITVKEQITGDMYKGEILIQARRPVYGTSYTTSLLNFKDENFSFTYKEFEQIEFNDNVFESNLSAVMAFYAYLIIGLDSDSFSLFGGNPYFQKAENIVNMAQSTSESGWRAFESRKNRYEIINNLTDERLKRIREFSYYYHRLGLDEMHKNPSNARAKIAQNIKLLQEANRNKPSSLILQMFFDAKDEELTSIFTEGLDKEKKEVYEILVELSPTKANKYEKLRN